MLEYHQPSGEHQSTPSGGRLTRTRTHAHERTRAHTRIRVYARQTGEPAPTPARNESRTNAPRTRYPGVGPTYSQPSLSYQSMPTTYTPAYRCVCQCASADARTCVRRTSMHARAQTHVHMFTSTPTSTSDTHSNSAPVYSHQGVVDTPVYNRDPPAYSHHGVSNDSPSVSYSTNMTVRPKTALPRVCVALA